MKILATMAFMATVVFNLNAQSAQDHVSNGVDAYQKKLFDDAIAEFDTALGMDSTLHQAYFYRALSFGNVGSFDLSVPDLQKATLLAPNRDDYWVYLGMAYDLGVKDKPNALLSFNKAISINPASKEGYFRRGLVYYSMMEDAKACADLLKAVELGHAQASNFKTKYCAD